MQLRKRTQKEKKEDKEESLRRGLLELCDGKNGIEDYLFFTLNVERQTA